MHKDSLMPLVYVAGPYRSNTHEGVWKNIMTAREYAVKLWKQGYSVVCPHLNTMFMGGVVSEGVFLAGTLEMLKRCDHIFMLPYWQDSEGSKIEKEYADSHGITEVFIE